MKIVLLGPARAYIGEDQIQLPGKAFCLIAFIALSSQYQIDRDVLRQCFWGNATKERRAGNLRQLLLRMSDATGGVDSPIVAAKGRLLTLRTDIWDIDLIRLRKNAGTAQIPVDILTSVSELLEDVSFFSDSFDDWLREQRTAVSKMRENAIRRALLTGMPFLGSDELLDLGRRLLDADPLDEVAYRAVIRAHMNKNELPQARRFYSECARVLRLEYDSEPQAETRELGRLLGISAVPAEPRSSANPQVPTDPTGIPRLLLLPAVSVFSDPIVDRVARGLLDDVTNGLCHYRNFRVIAAHTSLELANRSVTSDQISLMPNHLQFDYVISIGVKGSGANMVASCRLTRSADGHILWTVDLSLSYAALQASFENLVRRVVISLADAIEKEEIQAPMPDNDPTAYRLYLEGKRALSSTNLPSLRQARRWFRHSLKRSDSFAPALAGLSRSLTLEWLVRGMGEGDKELLEQSMEAARSSQRHDPNSGRGYRELGFASLYLRRHEDSVAYLAEARTLNPHDADLLVDFADALCHNGQPDEAEQYMALAMKLNPLPPDFYYWIQGFTQFRLGEYAKAAEALKPVARNPENARLLAATHAMSGNVTEARRFAKIVRDHYPNFSAEDVFKIVPDRSRSDTQQLFAGLVAAGLG